MIESLGNLSQNNQKQKEEEKKPTAQQNTSKNIASVGNFSNT